LVFFISDWRVAYAESIRVETRLIAEGEARELVHLLCDMEASHDEEPRQSNWPIFENECSLLATRRATAIATHVVVMHDATLATIL
jgi:hypothetical protein